MVLGFALINKSLVADYLRRGRSRLKALQILFDDESFADVVRESVEVVDLTSRALVRHLGAEPARVHDSSTQLLDLKDRLSKSEHNDLEKLVDASRKLRRDRELAFYGSEDLTPSEFYSKRDAEEARSLAAFSVEFVEKVVEKGRK